MYVGKAKSLVKRLWGNHLGSSASLATSALRRNVAQHLRFGKPSEIKSGSIRLSDEQLTAVHAWILECELAWLICATADDAAALEDALKAEFTPHLTKR